MPSFVPATGLRFPHGVTLIGHTLNPFDDGRSDLGLPAAPPPPSAARTPEWPPDVRGGADQEHAAGHWAD